MTYGFQKGKQNPRKNKGKPIAVYKLVGIFNGPGHIEEVLNIKNATYYAKNEKEVNGYVMTYNDIPGKTIQPF